jgi:hypothetical protein
MWNSRDRKNKLFGVNPEGITLDMPPREVGACRGEIENNNESLF